MAKLLKTRLLDKAIREYKHDKRTGNSRAVFYFDFDSSLLYVGGIFKNKLLFHSRLLYIRWLESTQRYALIGYLPSHFQRLRVK